MFKYVVLRHLLELTLRYSLLAGCRRIDYVVALALDLYLYIVSLRVHVISYVTLDSVRFRSALQPVKKEINFATAFSSASAANTSFDPFVPLTPMPASTNVLAAAATRTRTRLVLIS